MSRPARLSTLRRIAGAALAALLVAPAVSAQTAPAPALSRTQFIRDMDSEFAKMDADKNGKVSVAEAAAYERIRLVAAAEARNRAFFAQLDSDRNGQISPAEFRKVTPPAPPVDGRGFVAGKDIDKDNQVSLVEHRTATLANFDRLDTDKDGTVSPAEMKAAGLAK